MTIKRKKRATRKTIFFFSDIHFPHQDPAALAIAENCCRYLQPDIIVNLGDAIDAYCLSSFDKDPQRIDSMQEEFDAAAEHFKRLRADHPEARILMKEGNHEERLQRYLRTHAPGLNSLRCLSIAEQLGLPALDIEYYTAHQRVSIGDRVITHGKAVRGRSGASGQKELDDRGVSGVSGHVHRLGHTWHTNNVRTIDWVEAGCLCKLDACYAGDKSLNWQHGFAVGEWIQAHDIDRIDIQAIPIIDEVAHYRGMYYTPEGVITP